MNKLIAVVGAPLDLPVDFPIDYSENSGNMVHANAPYDLFGNCIHINKFKEMGGSDFPSFVNKNCSHLVITFANSLKLNNESGEKFARLQSLLERISVPIIPMGLGIQSKKINIESAALPMEAISLLNFFAVKCLSIGVRGEFTRDVIYKLSNARNIEVLGCPSFFTKPTNVLKLTDGNFTAAGTPAAAWTNYQNVDEADLLERTIRSDHFLIEPVNRFNHQFYIQALNGTAETSSIPYFFKNRLEVSALSDFFKIRYRLFRNINDWRAFNKEHVSFTYGTRFHVNMASVLSSKPALWITHDARTEELAQLFLLPSLDLKIFRENVEDINIPDLLKIHYSSKDFINNYKYRLDQFERFLKANGLSVMKYK